jgi:hypothetical protein
MLVKKEKVHVLVVEINVKFESKFVYWITNDGQATSYPMGDGQCIDLCQRGSLDLSLHGIITFHKGNWLLSAASAEEHIWVQLQPRKPFAFTQPQYKLMVAHYSVLDLSFHNFH